MKAKLYIGAKKYAIYIGRKIIEKTLEFLTLPAMFVSKKVQDLKNLTMWGQSIQDGTPTPTTPIEIGSVGEKQLLPYGYTQLEYLESTGTQYIITDFSTESTNIKLETSINWTNTTTRQIMGSNGGKFFGVVNGYWQFGHAGTTLSSIVANTNTWYDIEFLTTQTSSTALTNTLTVNGIQASYSRTYSQAERSFILMSLGDTGSIVSTAYNARCKIKRTKIYLNEILTRDFVPCKNSSNVIGMYDIVSGQFFANNGTGAFIAGTEIGQGGYKVPVVVNDTTTNIYLNEPLRKIGDYADVMSIDGTNVTVTRNVGSKLFNGTENYWTIASGNYFSVLKTSIGTNSTILPSGSQNAISSRFANSNSRVDLKFSVGGSYINFVYDALNYNVSTWTNWLSNNNVEFVYPIANPTTETYTIENPIQLEQGTLTLDTDTNIKPSKINITGDIDNA